MRLITIGYLILSALLLVSCGKSPTSAPGADRCAKAKGAPGLESDAQARQSCRDNQKFVGAPAKRSNIQITNH